MNVETGHLVSAKVRKGMREVRDKGKKRGGEAH